MDNFPRNNGLNVLPEGNAAQQNDLWRPWVRDQSNSAQDADLIEGEHSVLRVPKPPQFIHPVKLMWPKSKWYDYLYQDAAALLRNYPVQATICPYDDSSSEEDSEDEEEEMEKELN